MSDGSPKDQFKRLMPTDEDVDAALEAAMRQEAASAPTSGALPQASLQVIRAGGLARGTVLALTQDRVIVDLSYKSEGIIPLDEFGENPPAVGAEVQALVVAMEDEDGQVPLSIIEAQRRQIWDAMAENAKQGPTDVQAKILEAVKGGLVCDVGVRAFMPAKELDLRYVEDLEVYVGREFQVRVIEVDRAKNRVVVSRRALLRETRERDKAKLFETLEVGQRLEGEVTNITDFGVFVDLGGAEGLVHKGDLAWGRVEDASEIVKPGQKVQVMVTSFDRSNGRIGLSIKDAGPSPWDDAGTRFAEGTRHMGTVVGMLDFGAVVEIDTGVQGLLHISEMSWSKRVRKPEDVCKLQDQVEVEVIALDLDKRKISLSIKRVEENPWSDLESRYSFATVVHGVVTELAEFGAFIKLDDGVEGLVHVSELSWTKRVNHPKEMLEVGQRVDAIVLGSDSERQRLSLSIKKTEPDPWWDIEERYPIGSTTTGKVMRTKQFGAFVEIETGVEGLIHISRLGPDRVSRVEDVVRAGDTVTVEIVEADEEARKMGLALVPADAGDEEED